MAFLGKSAYMKLIIFLATDQSQCFMVTAKDGGLSTLCHNCGFACQQRLPIPFPDGGSLLSENMLD